MRAVQAGTTNESFAAVRSGPWRIWLPGGSATAAAEWAALIERLATADTALHRSKHAATHRQASPAGDAFVKIYRRYRGRTAVKDRWRASKAENVLRMSERLAAAGFRVPRILAAGEDREGARLRRAWVATSPLGGEPIATWLAHHAAAASTLGAPAACPTEVTPTALASKRAVLAALGAEVARLHEAGFVAGDLVPANVWIIADGTAPAIAFLDHDRTRAGTAAARWWHARRNLVQLNRVPLLGVTATDRLRVYRAYAAYRRWNRRAARRRLDWIIRKTIARRHRFDRVPHAARSLGFRALMRADGPYAPAPGRSRPPGRSER